MAAVTDLYSMVAFDEGSKTTVYKDTEGYWTVGVGHLLSKKPSMDNAIAILDSQVKRSTKGSLTTAEVQTLFQQDLDKVLASVKVNEILYPIYLSLDSVRRLGLLNMVFQMGADGVASFKNSLTLIRNKSYTQAGINLRKSKWYSQTPNRAERVIKVLTSGTLDAYN